MPHPFFLLVVVLQIGWILPIVNCQGNLPLLPQSKRPVVGIVYSSGEDQPGSEAILQQAFADCITAGVNGYQLSTTWRLLDTAGTVDISSLISTLDTVQGAGLVPYLSIKTIDTNTLQIPLDLVDSGNNNQLLAGLNWNSSILATRFNALLDQVVPALIARGGFYLSVGNEIDGWLANNPSEQENYAFWVSKVISHAHGLNASLAMGATFSFSALVQSNAGNNLYGYVQPVIGLMDAVAITYHPLDSNFNPQDPAVVSGDFNTMLSSIQGKQLLLQEVGLPSGYQVPTNGGSEEKQRQFVENVLLALAAHEQRIPFLGYYLLNDFSPISAYNFSIYYGLPGDAGFIEYLRSVGIRRYENGTAKLGYQQFLTSLQALRAGTLNPTTGNSSTTSSVDSPHPLGLSLLQTLVEGITNYLSIDCYYY